MRDSAVVNDGLRLRSSAFRKLLRILRFRIALVIQRILVLVRVVRLLARLLTGVLLRIPLLLLLLLPFLRLLLDFFLFDFEDIELVLIERLLLSVKAPGIEILFAGGGKLAGLYR